MAALPISLPILSEIRCTSMVLRGAVMDETVNFPKAPENFVGV